MTLTSPRRFELTDVATPVSAELAEGEVLVDVLAGGVCGSDLPFYTGHVSPLFEDDHALAATVPGFPLHEIVARVVASRDDHFGPNDRVIGWATNTNALSQRIITRGDSLGHALPEITMEQALVIQPLACVLGTLDRLPFITGRVAVVGLGPFGLLFSHALKQRGAAHVVGVDPIDRSAVLRLFGIDEQIVSTSDRWAARLSPPERFDLVMEVVGHQSGTLNDAVHALGEDGRVFCFGVPEESHQTFVLRELFRRGGTLLAGAVTRRREAVAAAQAYLLEHPGLTGLVTHHFDLADAGAAFQLAATPAPDRLKVAIHISASDPPPSDRHEPPSQLAR